MPGSDSSSELNPDLPGFAQKVKELEEKKKAAEASMGHAVVVEEEDEKGGQA